MQAAPPCRMRRVDDESNASSSRRSAPSPGSAAPVPRAGAASRASATPSRHDLGTIAETDAPPITAPLTLHRPSRGPLGPRGARRERGRGRELLRGGGALGGQRKGGAGAGRAEQAPPPRRPSYPPPPVPQKSGTQKNPPKKTISQKCTERPCSKYE